MNVLIITPYYPPGLGGACRMLEGITLGLIDRHHDVEVLTFGEPMYQGCEEFDSKQLYKVHRIPAEAQRSRAIVRMAIELLGLCAAKKYDVILCGVAWSSAVIALLARVTFKIPYCIYTHGEDTTVVQGSRYKEYLLKWAFWRCSGLLTNSNFSKSMVDRLAPAGVCEVLFPAIDPDPYLKVTKSQTMEIKTKFCVEDAVILLTVARLQRRKGHDTVVRSLSELSKTFVRLRYVIVGKGDRSELTQLAIELKVLDRIVFIDSLDESSLAAIFNAADVYVMVSRWDPDAQEVEGFGMTYLEAAAAGKPSIAGVQGGTSDAVVNGVTGILVDPESVDQTTEAIIRLLDDPKLALSMGNAGRERVLTEFSIDKFLDRIETVLRDAV